MLFFYLAPPTQQNSGIFHDSTRPHLHSDGLPPKSRRSVVSIWDLGCVTSITEKKHSRSGLAWSHPRADPDRGLSRPTSVFRTTIGVCKILSDRLRFGSTRAKTCFGVKTENGQAYARPSIIIQKLETLSYSNT